MPNNKIAVVGYGNSLRGDDGVGIVSVRQIKDCIFDVDTYEYHQLSIEVLPVLADYEKIIFIDCCTDIGHGEVECIEIQSDDEITLTMTHHLSPQQILRFVEILYNKSPIVYLCKIGGRVFEFGCSISKEVIGAVPKVVENCIKLINSPVH